MVTRSSKPPKKVVKKKATKKPPKNTKPATPEEIERIKQLLLQNTPSSRREAIKLGEKLHRDDQAIIMQWSIDKLKDAIGHSQRVFEAERERRRKR
jgi:hypothetical protein